MTNAPTLANRMVRPSGARARDLFDREQAAGAAAVFHHHVGLQPRADLGRDDARERIDRTAGRERNAPS